MSAIFGAGPHLRCVESVTRAHPPGQPPSTIVLVCLASLIGCRVLPEMGAKTPVTINSIRTYAGLGQILRSRLPDFVNPETWPYLVGRGPRGQER